MKTIEATTQQQEFMRDCIGKGMNETAAATAWVAAVREGTCKMESNVNKMSDEQYGRLLYADVCRRLGKARKVRKGRQ